MCSIVSSFSKEKFIELAKLNEYRGTHSHSICYYDTPINQFFSLQKGIGTMDYKCINPFKQDYIIGHQQAPTTQEKSISTIHPASIGDDYLLWHNGILKPKTINELQQKLKIPTDWDTLLLLHSIVSEGFNSLNSINGTFACIFYSHGKLFTFRNEISPLFIDDELNISSTNFDGARSIPANTIFLLDLEKRKLQRIENFKTVENPYYMGT